METKQKLEGLAAWLRMIASTMTDAPGQPPLGAWASEVEALRAGASEVMVLLIEHDGDDSPSVALARDRTELLAQVKVAVWGEPHPADTTNDFGDDMAEGITDTLLETGVMTFEGDPPLRLVRVQVEGWFTALAAPMPAPQAPITWPNEKRVGRREDMSPDGTLVVGLDSDNDVYVAVAADRHGEWQEAAVEFCNGGGGGGSSPHTRAALINLMTAIEADNAARPDKAFPPVNAGLTIPAGLKETTS
jgi:hypothetical protein